MHKKSAFFRMLDALERGDFILRYVPFGKGERETHYKLIDPFCIFSLKRVKGNEAKRNYFVNSGNSPVGLAFENLCLNHLGQIERKLGISGIQTQASFFASPKEDGHPGGQIDLIITRKDGDANLCEMEFYSDLFACDECSHLALEGKIAAIKPFLGRKASIFPVLVTTFGLRQGAYASDYPSVVALKDLFM